MLQRYAIIDPTDYDLAAGSKFESQAISNRGGSARFTRETREQTRHRVVDTTQRRGDTAWKTTKKRRTSNKALPRVRYGSDGTDALAVEDTAGEARVFYATPAVVVASNAKLAEVGADARLADVGGELEGPADPTNLAGPTVKLHMVKPAVVTGGIVTATEKFGQISECNSFIKYVIGEKSDRVAVFGAGAGHEAVVDEEHEPTKAIAEFAADRPAQNAAALAAHLETGGIRAGSHEEALPARYTTMGGKGARDQALGINAGALAGVGEGYMIASNDPMPGDKDANVKLRDYIAALDKKVAAAAMTPDEMAMFKSKWGYHYAGIVARVGRDSISLENYNRGTQLDWILDDLYTTQMGAVRELRDHLVALADADAKAMIPAIPKLRRQWMREQQMKLAALGDRATVEQGSARDALKQVTDAVKGMEVGAPDLWHFKMYGTNPGQSFHEQWAGALEDPMTLRVRQSNSSDRRHQMVVDAIAALRAEHPHDQAEQVLLRAIAGPMVTLAAATTAPTIARAYAPCKADVSEAIAIAIRGWGIDGAKAAGKKIAQVPDRPDDLSKVAAYGAEVSSVLDSWRITSTAILPASKKRKVQVNTALADAISHVDAAAAIEL